MRHQLISFYIPPFILIFALSYYTVRIMKKLILLLSAASLLLTGCATKHINFGNLKIDYPSDCKITHMDNNGQTLSCIIENGKDDSSYLFLEITEENKAAIESAEPQMVLSYLKGASFDLLQILVSRNERISLSRPVSPGDIISIGSAQPEVCAHFDGKCDGLPYYGAVRCKMLGNYKVSVISQGADKASVNELIEKIYYTARIK